MSLILSHGPQGDVMIREDRGARKYLFTCEDRAAAAELVIRWNAYPKLVAALDKTVSLLALSQVRLDRVDTLRLEHANAVLLAEKRRPA